MLADDVLLMAHDDMTGRCNNACCQRELDRLTVREIAGRLAQGQLSLRQAERVFHRVNERYQDKDALTDAELEALRELRAQLTDVISPCTVEQLDKRVAELDAKFPDWAHFYHRVGTMVTWHDRPRSPDHPLWQFYPHDTDGQAEGREGDAP